MSQERYDAAVVGAGIHGAGVAQAAVAAGYRVLLLEKNEPAAGTSSRSSKLIHGGLRYLETGQFSLVRESLRERRLLLQNAPGLVRLVPFYIPIYKHTTRRPWQIRIGLSLYAVLGSFGPGSRFRTLPKPEWERFPHLKKEGLQTIFEYQDGQTDDAALTRAVVESARSLGADVRFPAALLAATRIDDGFRLRYQLGDQTVECDIGILINTAGPWVNLVRDLVEPAPPRMDVDLVQGAHVVLDQKLCDGIFYVESPSDRRAVFLMPWKDRTLVGTTESPFDGPPDEVRALDQEVDYLVETVKHYMPGCQFAVTESFAGLRVLPSGKGLPFTRSRETILLTDSLEKTTYLAVYGGKLTGYRATAEKVLRLLQPSLPRRKPIADTRTLPLG